MKHLGLSWTGLSRIGLGLAGLGFGLALAACQGEPQPATLEEVHQGLEWQHMPGAELNASFKKSVKHILLPMPRADAIDAIKAAGYDCTYGEAHEDYPEPAAVCTRSFATRACQMDWEIMVTSDPKKPGKVDDADASFRRDCVGVDDDWPDAKRSAIDDGLAPAQPPN